MFDLERPFLRPDPHGYTDTEPARGEAVKDGRVGAHRRLVLDGFEHGGTLAMVGMTIGGEPACGSTNIRATSLYSVGAKTRTMMQ